jgi:hypothetical protein
VLAITEEKICFQFKKKISYWVNGRTQEVEQPMTCEENGIAV